MVFVSMIDNVLDVKFVEEVPSVNTANGVVYVKFVEEVTFVFMVDNVTYVKIAVENQYVFMIYDMINVIFVDQSQIISASEEITIVFDAFIERIQSMTTIAQLVSLIYFLTIQDQKQ
uniref:Uncharacterized protein n=1 Tax=Pithovirus LCPAC404 TaxID=2506597 RepID=A0A481ZGX8_9VIRU|nr:MAG: hypothetical protein LCPAC404_02350 [Pithovirus LCPAC404]